MRKSFTRFFGFLLLSVFMLYSSVLRAQETQSTVELYAGTVDACYNASDSYAAKISVKDFIKIKSFIIELNYDETKFVYKGISVLKPELNPLFSVVNDPIGGSVQIWWTNAAGVTIGDNLKTDILSLNFGVVGFPNNSGTNLFTSPLTWESAQFWYAPTGGGSDEVRTTNTFPGSLRVAVNYPSITYTVDPATCAGSTATIHVTSPVGTGLKYYFNGSTTASTSPVADAQAPSTNTVLVVDANGCQSHLFSIPVGAPNPLSLDDVTTEDPLCFNGMGEIQFTISGGTAPYTYWVVPSANWAVVNADLNTKQATDPVFANYKFSNFQVLKPGGTYYVAVNDANGCKDLRDDAEWQTVTITPITSDIAFTTAKTDNLCNGNTAGTITVSAVSGGTGPDYTVSRNGINWYSLDEGDYTFTGLAAGTYTISVKDVNGCVKTSSVTITQPASLAFNVTYTDASCAGGATGSITVPSVTGGTAPFEFVVATAGSAMPGAGWTAVGGPITGLAANYYSVWVRDANGCTKAFANQDGTGNILPIQAPGALTFTTNSDNAANVEVSCNGDDFTLSVTAAGGVAPYTYSFDGGVVYSSTKTLVLSDLVLDAVVSVYVKDANGCIANRSVTVDVPDLLTIAAFTNVLLPTCPGGNDGRTTVNVAGGTAPYTYSTDNVTWYANNVLALPEGATKVYVKDAKGCVTNATVNPGTLTPIALTAASTGVISCYGDDESAGIAITGLTWQAGRSIQYYVASTSAAVFTSGSVFVPASVNGTPNSEFDTFAAGVYYVGARDNYGCTSTIKTVTITQEPALSISSVTSTNATCSGLFNGTLTINTAGGNDSPILYAVVNNKIAIENLTAGDFLPIDTYNSTTNIGKQIVQAQRGTYYVVLRNSCNTDNKLWAGPFFVDGYKPIALDEENYPLSVTDITCHDADNGIIQVNLAGVSGGKPGFDGAGLYTFKLYATGEGSSLVATNTTGKFVGLEGGDYFITITDASNCPLYTTETVEVVNPAQLAISLVDVTHFTCKGSNDGIIEVNVTGGTGNYWLAVNASVNGLGTDIKASDWIAFASGQSSKIYVATSAGAYKLFVKDANGCLSAPVSTTILEPKVLTPVVASKSNVTCNGSATGSVDIDVTGGWEPTLTQSYVFTLKKGATTVASNSTGVFNALTAGDYVVSVKTDGNEATYSYPAIACSYTVSFTITQPVAITYKASVVDVACKDGENGSLTVTVLGGGTPDEDGEYQVQLISSLHPNLLAGDWVWTEGKVAKFEGLEHSIYSVFIRDANGCLIPETGEDTATADIWNTVASWEVNEPATALTASVTWNNDVTCYGGNDGKFTVTAAGGVGGYKYAAKISQLPVHLLVSSELVAADWQDSPVFDKAIVGTYIIWVKDANGCIVGGEGDGTPVDEWRVQVKQPVQVDFSLGYTEPSCFGTATGTITASSIVSAAGYPYTITVTGTDASGAAVNITKTIASGAVTATGVPASVTKPVYSEPTPNAFTVKVTDKNGCSNTHSIVVWQNPALTADIVKANGAFICPGDNNGVIDVVATGGTGAGTYSYRLWRDGVAYTSWVTIPSFLVQVGHTWAVEVKDANGCLKTDEEILVEPKPVLASLRETTCYGDAKASVVVSATGETGRTFSVRYKINTGSYGSWVALNANNELAISNLEYANITETENFYYFQVKDDQGCMTEEIKKPFVATQHPLEATVVQTDLNADLAITGGISPYKYQVGSNPMVQLPVNGNQVALVNLPAGSNVISIYDAHGCTIAKTVVVDPVSVTAVPASGNNQPNTFNVVLTFNRTVTVAAGDITGGTFTPGTAKTFTVAMAGDDLAALSLVLGTGIKDAAGNTFAGATFPFKVGDHVAPTVVVTPPASPVATVFTVGLKFSEAVSGVLGSVTVTGGTLTDVAGLGDTYTFTVSAVEQKEVTIVLSDGIKDISANTNKFAGLTLKYTTGDFTAPSLETWTPLDETITGTHPTFTMTLSENVVVAAGGNLKVYKVATTTPVLTIPITAAMINGKVVTVTYAVTQSGLDKDSRYYVLVEGTALKDNAGNAFAGVSDISAWTFKTGPAFTTGVDPIVNGSLEFKVYPNPFVDYVNVANSSELSKVVVTNIAGQMVKEVVNPTERIQLNELRSGIYFMSLYNSDDVIVKTAKIVKR